MKIELTQTHALDTATLRARLVQRFEHYAARYTHLPLRERVRWYERTARGSYAGGDGTLTLDERTITVVLELPVYARPLRERIERLLRSELARASEPLLPA